MDIVITGSVAFDYLMKFPGYFRDHFLPDKLDHISLSFLVESMTVQRGGVAPNICYTLALLGGKPRLMATVGVDFENYRTYLEGRGIDTSLAQVIEGVFTASFFANTDRSNAQIASFYPGAMGYAAQLSFHDLESKPDLVVISPNDPGAMDHYVRECRALGIPYFYDPSQQLARLDPVAVRFGIENARALFVNDYELGMVERLTSMKPTDILGSVQFMVVTRGEEGSTLYTHQGEIHVPIVPGAQIVDPTGVGDAFRGGFLTGYSHAWNLELCGQMGSLAATYCLEQSGPQGHSYSPTEFVKRFRESFDDHGKLDVLCG